MSCSETIRFEKSEREPCRLSHNRLPFEHPYQDVAAAQAPPSAATALGTKDPFIYNPKKGPTAARARPTIVLNEVTEVMVTLQNPFLFELEIQNIELRSVYLH